MLIPPYSTSRYLNSLPDSIIDSSVRHDDVASLRESWYNTRDCRERLRVHDACRSTQVLRYIGLSLDVNILGAVEARGTAGADTVFAEYLYGFLFEGLVRD